MLTFLSTVGSVTLRRTIHPPPPGSIPDAPHDDVTENDQLYSNKRTDGCQYLSVIQKGPGVKDIRVAVSLLFMNKHQFQEYIYLLTITK